MSELAARLHIGAFVAAVALVLSACAGAQVDEQVVAAEAVAAAPIEAAATTAPLADPTEVPGVVEQAAPTTAPTQTVVVEEPSAVVSSEPVPTEEASESASADVTSEPAPTATPLPEPPPTVAPTATPPPEPSPTPAPPAILVPQLVGEFPTVSGSQIDLGSLQGQDVVLWFWAPW